jgi:hypothetical protein
MKFPIPPQAGLSVRFCKTGGSNAIPRLECRVNTIVEGPYRTILRTLVQHRHHTVALVAGGGSITAVWALLEQLSHLMSLNYHVACATKRNVPCRFL